MSAIIYARDAGILPGSASYVQDASLPYHQNVSITGNVFKTKSGPLLYALCTRGPVFADNVYDPGTPHTVVTEFCSDTQLK